MRHDSVLLTESLNALDLLHRSVIIDATLGLGGHSEACLIDERFSGNVIGVDQDQNHLDYALHRLASFGNRFQALHMNFSVLGEWLDGSHQSFDGILFDLGVASPHFDEAERGFSYHADGPLDMRMNRGAGKTAADLLMMMSSDELAAVFRDYGEERFAKPIAKEIIRRRADSPFERTSQLVSVIEDVYPKRLQVSAKKHPATQVFQALRIAVNDELRVLEDTLSDVVDRISAAGRIVVISYHSLEDRIVKQFFRKESNPCVCPPKLPHCACGKEPRLRILHQKAIVPTTEEIQRNPRARSAKMRVAERL